MEILELEYINLNGVIYNNKDVIITPKNRAFRYGDALFETIRIVGKKVCFLNDHLSRLKDSMNFLKMIIPETLSVESIKKQAEELIEQNNLESDGRIRLTVFRNEGGYYTPLNNEISYIIELEKLKEVGYILNNKGFVIDIYQELKKTSNRLSNIKSANSLIYVLAGIFRTKNNLDDCIILNENMNILESISSNIFAVKNGVLYTPPVPDGCVDGIMRKQIIRIAKDNKMAVYEISFAFNILLNSDEIFLCNAINGIRWVGAYKNKRYFNNASKALVEKLNESLI